MNYLWYKECSRMFSKEANVSELNILGREQMMDAVLGGSDCLDCGKASIMDESHHRGGTPGRTQGR